MPRAAPALAAALAALLCGGVCAAQDPACKAPFERSQELRQEGKLVAARAALDACVQACPSELGEQCKIWIGEVEPQIGRLVIVAVDGEGKAQDAAQIQLDGRSVPRAEWAGAIRVDPGEHSVVASAGELSGRGTIKIGPGASERITVTLRGGAPIAGPTASGERPSAAEIAPLIAGITVASASLLGGLGMVIGGHVLAADYAGRCRGADPACTERGAEGWRNQVSFLWLMGGLFAGLGGASYAGGLVALFMAPPPPKPGELRPLPLGGRLDLQLVIKPGAIGLRGSF